jgi:hypothetical protein
MMKCSLLELAINLYLKENSEEGLTYGAGFKYTLSSGMNLYINYGYADYGRLENVQFVDVGIGILIVIKIGKGLS